MTRYTVVWLDVATDQLAQLWIDAEDRKAIEEAGNAIDRELANDPEGKGKALSEGLRSLDLPPLHVVFTVETPDRRVKVLRVRRFIPFPPSSGNGQPPPATSPS
jgi:hypothetical protein